MVLDPSPPPLCVTPCHSSLPHLSRSRSRCRVLCYPLPFTLIVHIVYMLCVMLPSINTVHTLRGPAGTWVLLPSIRLMCRPRVLILVAVVGVVLHIDSKTKMPLRETLCLEFSSGNHRTSNQMIDSSVRKCFPALALRTTFGIE